MRWALLAIVLVGCGPRGGTGDAALYDVAPVGFHDPALVGRWLYDAGSDMETVEYNPDGTGTLTVHVVACNQNATAPFVWSTDGATLTHALTAPCRITQDATNCSEHAVCDGVALLGPFTWSISGDTLTLVTTQPADSYQYQRQP
jgi:hypothetical protein